MSKSFSNLFNFNKKTNTNGDDNNDNERGSNMIKTDNAASQDTKKNGIEKKKGFFGW